MADQVDEIKQKTDIVSLISEHIDLKKAGRNYKALCPFHSEKTPSFMVSPELQIFKCFGCFPADQVVKTPFGYHKIQNVVDGEYVVSGKGNIKKVLVTHKRDYEGELVTVKLSMLAEGVSLTEDHMVYAVGGAPLYLGKHKYLSKRLNSYKKLSKEERLAKIWRYFPVKKVRAGELHKGMTLLYPIDTTIRDMEFIDLSAYITKKWPPHGAKPLIPPLQVNVNEDLLKLIGYYIAEGSNHRAYLRFSLGAHEKELTHEIIFLLNKVFSLDASVHKRTKGKTGIEISCCNSILANVFENLCGKRAENKHIPFVFQHLPLDKQKVLLDAIWRGDGYSIKPCEKVKTPARAITTTSKTLEEQIRDILLRLGYFPSLNVQSGKIDKSGVNHKKSYTHRWLVNPKFSKFKHIYENQEGDKFWLLPILSIQKEEFRGKVYNLTVEHDHSYVANTFAVANCGESGDALSFLQKYEGMDFGEALKFLADRAGVKLIQLKPGPRSEKEKLFKINTLAARFYQYFLLKHSIGRPARDYLIKSRGLKPDTIEEFRLGFSPEAPQALKRFLVDKKKVEAKDIERAGIGYIKEGRIVDRFRGRVIFPLFDHRGNIAGFAGRVLLTKDRGGLAKYINSPETPIYHKARLLYGLNLTRDDVKKKRKAVVVEGELDMISSWQSGVKNVVAIKGSALTEDQARLLGRFSERLILALDSDFAGDAAARRGISTGQELGLEIQVAKLGKYKDPDEMARKAPDKYKKALSDAQGVWDFIIESVFSSHAAETGEGKLKISREIIPVLVSISDKIVQAHYVQVVAKKLGIEESAVAEQVADTKTQKVAKQEIEGLVKPETKSRRQLLEERALALAFQSDPKALKNLKIFSLVTTPLAKRILQEYKNFSKRRAEFNPAEFAQGLPSELVEGFAEMILEDMQGLAERADMVEKELGLIVQELKILQVKERLKELAGEIRDFEEKGKKNKLKVAQKKFSKLAHRLSDLKEGQEKESLWPLV